MYESQVNEILTATQVLIDANDEFGATWVLPSAYESLEFAFTEMAEVTDAYMRRNPKFFRNNAKDIDPNIEICDVMMMLTKYWMNQGDNWVAEFNRLLQMWELDYLPYNRQRFYRLSYELCSVLADDEDALSLYNVKDTIVYILVELYRMLPKGFYLQTIKQKMEKYRVKIAAVQGSAAS